MKKIFTFKNVLLLITYAILLIFLLINISLVGSVFSTVLDVVMPFIYGFILAYILSFPYNFFYNKCFRKVGLKHEKLKKVKKPLAMLLAYVVCFGIFAFLVGILIPELYNSIVSLVEELPGYMENIKEYMTDVLAFIKDKFGFDLYSEDNYNNLMSYLTGKSSSEIINTAITEFFPAALNFASGFATGLYNWIIGIFVSVYMLSSKDKLCRQLRSVVVAYLPLKISRKSIQIAELCNKKCGKFLIGKIIDSAIVGVMCFIGLSIFRFDYALLISVVIGITNVIPFFGPFLGAIPCAFLLLLVDPMESFWFIIFIIILQQFDGNVLGPKVLGESVGISGFWILVSVIVGGGLFGILGMLLGVPVFAVIYTLIKDGSERRLKKKRSAQTINEISLMLDELETDISEQCIISESDGSDKDI